MVHLLKHFALVPFGRSRRARAGRIRQSFRPCRRCPALSHSALAIWTAPATIYRSIVGLAYLRALPETCKMTGDPDVTQPLTCPLLQRRIKSNSVSGSPSFELSFLYTILELRQQLTGVNAVCESLVSACNGIYRFIRRSAFKSSLYGPA